MTGTAGSTRWQPSSATSSHTHTLLSDGDLILSEHVRRAEKAGGDSP